VEYLLLGPLEVRAARERLPLGGARQRAVLADLLLHAGSVVSMDTLIDDLWGAEPPATAEAVVQNAVSRLRKALGRNVIETRVPGYVLHADPGAIDARRFERLVHDARPLPPAERSDALRDALALWRGPAFADLAFEAFLQGEIARLDELRLTALEDRIEAETELGRHDDVIADASALGSRHPDRERLCRQLMLALQRGGRQQDALDAYEATRRALDEQWGLEPAPETRALQQMILTQDPAIAVGKPPARVVGPARRPVSLLLVEALFDEELELEAAGAALEEVRRTLADVVARHGGALSAESGVELVAAFGAEGAHEDDLVRAARSAIELREIVRDREVEARLAVGTGMLLVDDGRPVMVGAVVGQTRRALHDAEANEIQLTSVAARLGGDSFELDADGRLLGVGPGRPRSTADPPPLVGRSGELARLQVAFDRAVEARRPQHAVVVGEAGIGKSRLVAAFTEDVPAVLLQAACIPYGEGISFLPLRELAEQAAALDDGAPELGELSSADAALGAARALVEHFTADCPVVIVLDDVHWAVPTFLDLVEYVVRAVSGSLLVICATRPELLERRPSWGEEAIVLESLAGDDARTLVDALPERDALDEKVATAILEAAEGVPLFLEQLAAHAAESDLTDDRIPPTLDALLASRIDALEPGERAVLSRAAVVGRAFSRESIGALTPDAEAREIDGRLGSLERRRLVRPRGTDHEFVHPLVRGAAYDAVARPERAGMHERYASWLDERDLGDELVGAHLERAARDTTPGDVRDARSTEASARLARAGSRALLGSDYAAAANLLGRAAALLAQDDPTRLEVECSLGPALKGVGEWNRATDLLERVAERARAAGDRRLESRARVELIHPLVGSGSLTTDRAVEMLDAALVVLEEHGDTLGLARAELAYVSFLGDWEKRVDAAIPHLRRMEDAYRSLGIRGQTDIVAVNTALRGATPVADAVRLCEECVARHAGHPRKRAYLQANLAVLRALAADVVRAREAAAAARSELEELGEELGLGTGFTLHAGSVEAFWGDWRRAQAVFERGLEYTRDRPAQRAWHAYFLARLGEAALGLGDDDAAAVLAEEARGLTVAGDVETEIWWRRVAARALSTAGHPRKALRLGREAVAAADDTDDLLMQGEARLDLAEVLLRAGDRPKAAAVVREGLERIDRKGASLPAANGRSRFADLLAQAEGGGAATATPPERVS
jgi:DNA-binding SARP family transcriptional activator/tetratricopeptide (TPR) repeat protein